MSMMQQRDFFKHIELNYNSKMPFVAYRKPKDTMVRAMIQKTSEIYNVNDFSEIGFVFSPFDSERKSILFPFETCHIITSQISFSEENRTASATTCSSILEKNDHIELIQKGIDHIKIGQLKKVVLSRVESVPIPKENPIVAFKSLLKSYANAFVYIWYHPKIGLWLGATPETLLHVEGQRFQTMSLAGTQAYDGSKEVIWNLKNIEEQQLVTDFIEMKLKPFTQRITVAPSQTVKAGQLLHLKSKISGVLKPHSLAQVINHLHPTPAVCGLPKASAKLFILNNESYDREFYTGFLGELNLKTSQTRNTNKRNVENNAYSTLKNTSHLFVNLRCMQFKEQRALIYVGGGVTQDSIPKDEWEETVNKSQTMRCVLEIN